MEETPKYITMDGSKICAVVFGALMYLSVQTSNSELIVFPRDTEVLVNHSTYFNCSTSIRSEQIHWYHYHVGENQIIYVYYKGQFNKDYVDRYSIAIDTVTGEYNLIIRSVQPGDGGRYECQDDGGLGSKSSSELIVLDSIPICQSSMKQDGLVGPNSCGLPIDELHLSCSVSYSGNIPPTLQWKMEGDDAPILKGITGDYSVTRVAMNLTMSSGVEMDRVSFTCGTTRSHDKQYSCTTDPVKINYALDEPTILNITTGETVTCSANASVSCIYRWFYGNDTLCPASCIQVLENIRLGDYSCEANCPMNGLSCTFVARRIFVFETSSASEDTTKTLLLAVLISTVAALLLAIGLCILFFKMRKGKAVTRQLQEENVQLRQSIMSSKGDTSIIETCIKGEITTKASKELGRAIAGVAILEDLIYVASDNSSEVETFDLETLELKNRRNLEELVNPWNLASCKLNKCLYIMDLNSITKPKHVIRFDSDVRSLVRWSTGEEYGNLSVTRDGNVIITFCDKSRLFIYGPDGTRMNVVHLSVDVIHPSHALELSKGQFLISHGLNKDNIHRVSILNENGEHMKNSFERMETPSYLAVDEYGLVFVADQGNSRVCVLNSDLELIEEVASRRNGLRSPQRICLDRKTERLFVVDNEGLEFKREKGKLLVFKYGL